MVRVKMLVLAKVRVKGWHSVALTFLLPWHLNLNYVLFFGFLKMSFSVPGVIS
jgi:hypothetical protein